jgi:hypothetical protein
MPVPSKPFVYHSLVVSIPRTVLQVKLLAGGTPESEPPPELPPESPPASGPAPPLLAEDDDPPELPPDDDPLLPLPLLEDALLLLPPPLLLPLPLDDGLLPSAPPDPLLEPLDDPVSGDGVPDVLEQAAPQVRGKRPTSVIAAEVRIACSPRLGAPSSLRTKSARSVPQKTFLRKANARRQASSSLSVVWCPI